MYDLIIPHLHSKAPLPYLPNFVNCFCTKIQHFSSCIPLFVPYNKKSRHIFVLSAQKRRPRPAPNTQKIRPGPSHGPGLTGGRGWIRTTEALSSRFTVCPHWPLGNTPLFCFHRAGVLPGDLFILPQALLFVNSFFKLFRSSAPGCRSGRQRAAGPYPVVQPAAPDCLLILAPAGAFVNREFAFWGGIVVS